MRCMLLIGLCAAVLMGQAPVAQAAQATSSGRTAVVGAATQPPLDRGKPSAEPAPAPAPTELTATASQYTASAGTNGAVFLPVPLCTRFLCPFGYGSPLPWTGVPRPAAHVHQGFAVRLTSSGLPLAGRRVDLDFGGQLAGCSLTTDPDGWARCRHVSPVPVLSWSASFAGDAEYLPSRAHGPVGARPCAAVVRDGATLVSRCA